MMIISKTIRISKLYIFLFLALLFLSSFGFSQQNNLKSTLNSKIPELIKKAMIPGLSISVIKDGKQIWTKSFGVKSTKTNELVTDETIFEAASLSKPVFAYGFMKLVEVNKIDLDTPLIKYISKEYLERNFLGRKIDDKRIYKITARMCLSHTPGFPNWRGRGKLRLINNPGKKFSYSGEGFGYLQKVVEKITGLSLNEFIKKEVFDPLGMVNSSYIWIKQYESSTAYPHGILGITEKKRKGKIGHAAASLHTTASDYAKYIMAIMNYKGLKQKTVQLMLIPQVVMNPKESDKVSWGLGFGLEKSESSDAFLWPILTKKTEYVFSQTLQMDYQLQKN